MSESQILDRREAAIVLARRIIEGDLRQSCFGRDRRLRVRLVADAIEQFDTAYPVDPLHAAVDAELAPLAEQLTEVGHTLAKGTDDDEPAAIRHRRPRSYE